LVIIKTYQKDGEFKSLLNSAKMSKRKGLSVEEKRQRMMEFFFEKKEFFQLKELEKQCQKEKGITSMSVKEVLQSLVDDGMVDTDKIGTSVYLWAFPSKASQNRKRKLESVTHQLEEGERKRRATEEMIAKSKLGREDSELRSRVLAQLSERQSAHKALLTEIASYQDCDPEVMQQMKRDAVTAKEASNRWTDNVFAIKSWIKNKFNFDESTIDKQFEIPDGFDYIN